MNNTIHFVQTCSKSKPNIQKVEKAPSSVLVSNIIILKHSDNNTLLLKRFVLRNSRKQMTKKSQVEYNNVFNEQLFVVGFSLYIFLL